MSTSGGNRQETLALKTGFDPPIDPVPPDHPGFLCGYTYAEVQEALLAGAEVVRLSKEIGESVYKLVIAAIEFRDRGYFRWLGLNSFNEWYTNEGFVPTSISKYMKMYIGMTDQKNIPLDEYKSVDLAKTNGFLKLISAGASARQLKAALDVARDLSSPDWNQWAKEAADNIKAGRDIGDPIPLPDP